MTSSLEFFFDCSSPWTYLAFEAVQPIAREAGAAIIWRPILVGGIFNSINPSVYESRINPVPAKAAYLKKDLADWSRSAGLPLVFPPSRFPVNSVKVMRGCLWLGQGEAQVMFARAAFQAYWRDDRDISCDDVIRDICATCGIEADALLEGMASAEIRQELRSTTEELIDRGGFGSPTIFIGGDMYFGNDRLVLVREALRRLNVRCVPDPASEVCAIRS